MSENVLEGYRLAPQQKRVWLQQSDTAPFVCQCILQVVGELDSRLLEKAVARALARHEGLRTFFPSLPGMELPIQAITDRSTAGVEPVTPEGLPSGLALDDALLEFGRYAVKDFSDGPLVHFALCTAAPGGARLAITASSLCADEWSLRNLVDELATACDEGDGNGEEAEEPVQYVQFSEWQNELLESAESEAGQQHWREHSLLALADFELPGEGTAGAEARRGTVGACRTRVEADLVDRLEALARKHGVGVRACLLAVWQTLLGRLADRRELAVAVLCGGRPYEEMHGAVGLYARWPLVSSGGRHRSFLAALQETDRRVLEAEEWQEYFSWDELDGSGEAQPIPYGFSWNEWSEPAAGNRVGFLLQRHFVVSERFKAELVALRLGRRLELELRYDPELFSETEARRLAARYLALLSSAVERPAKSPRDLDLLGQAERAALLCEWNDTAAPRAEAATLVDLFAAQIERAPEAIAVVLEERALSYGELERRSRRLARRLRSLGVRGDSKVLLCTDRSLELVVGALGILEAGGAFVPIDPWQPEERLRLMIEDLETSVGVVEERWRGFLESHLRTLVVLGGEQQKDPSGRVGQTATQLASPASGDAAYVIFTSGSTGRPKGVVIEHRSVVHLTSALDRAVYDDLGSVGRVSINAPLSFDASIKQLIQLFLGRTVCLIPEEIRPDGEAMLGYLRRLRVEVLDCTPVQLSLLLAAGLAGGRGVPRAVLVGGEAIGPRLWTTLSRDAERKYYNVYGPSECTVDATSLRIARSTPRPSLGRPLSNVAVYLLDRDGRPVPVGLEGELQIGGAGLARGYLASPRRTAERFVPDPFSDLAGERLYRTGDRASQLRDGALEFLGRVDLQVKVRGIRVELGEIEATLNKHLGIREAVVTLRADGSEEPRLVAYVITRVGADVEAPAVDEDDLRAYLRAHLPDYMVPQVFVLLDQLPLNRSGKIDRLSLPRPEEIRPAEPGEVEPPATPFEETVAAIWRDVLGAERIGRRGNFFELGGHSLLATQLMARIRSILKVDLPLRTLFDGPTVAELAARVEIALAGAGSDAELPLEPVPRDRPLPLSFGQERLWFLHQLEPLSSAYNAFKAVILDGSLDVAAMRAALDEVVRRHEVLRTHFVAGEAGPRQVIESAAGLALPVIDLSHLDAEARQGVLERRAEREARWPFDLSRGPFLRCALLRLEAEEHVFHLALHHIVGDAWSLEMLVRELTALYGAAARRERSPLPELEVQYADFAVWQRRRLEGQLLEAQLAYWQRQLEGQPSLLELPTDRPRPPVQTDRGDHCVVVLPPRLSADLEELARRESVTSFMLLLAAWQTLLGRCCGRDDVSVGTPIAGRSRVEVEPLIGFFVNTLVMRLDLAGDPSFRQLLDRAREMTLGAFAHQDLPFERLVGALPLERDTSYTPLFQAMFVFQNVGAAEVDLPDIQVRAIRPVAHAAMFDLTLTLVDSPSGLRGALEYNVDLFDRTTSLRWPRQLVSLLEGLVADPGRALSELPIFDAAERSQILIEWNDTRAVADERLVHELFAHQAAIVPSAVALETPERAWSYAELDQQSNRLARHLRELGVAPEVLVGVCLQRGAGVVVTFLAVLKAGGAYLPLDPNYPRARLRYLLDDAGVGLVLTERRLAPALPVAETQLLLLDEVLSAAAAQRAEPLRSSAREDNLAYVIYTSGSTGGPKGVEVRHRSLARFTLGAIGRYGFDRGDRVLQFASLSFDTSCEEIFPTLAIGATLVVGDGSVPSVAELLELAESRSLTVLDLPTAYWHQLSTELEEGGRSLAPSVRLVILGGERALAEPLRRWWRAVDPRVRLWNSYGPTETTVTATGGTLGAELTIGRPDADVRVHVLDAAFRSLPIGAAGELVIGGEGVARGYRQRPELTAQRFVPDPRGVAAGSRLYRTGDRVRYLADGRLDFRGRLDSQLKIRGFRVEPGEIENELRHHPGVAEAAVVAYEERPGDLRLVAHVVPSAVAERADWRRFLGERLPAWSVPSNFSIHAELPRLTSGKIDRAALARWRPPSKSPRERGGLAAEAAPVEELLADLWGQLLGVEVAGREEDFFTLGGHSLLATQMVARIRHLLGVELPLREIFEHRTLAALAARIERARSGGGPTPPPIRVVSRDVPPPLSFGQERLWFLQQLEPASPAYNIPASLSIEGELDVPALAAAFGELVRRHEVLRTVYPSVEGRPIQAITPTGPVALPVMDLTRFDSAARTRLCRQLTSAEAFRPFDLEQGPVLRVTLLSLAETEHRLLLTMHHIASDGWSTGILTSELSELYRAASRGGASRLRELPVQYADFAAWQRGWLEGAVLDGELAYWRRRLRGLPSLLELPTDRPRPKLASYRGGSRRLRLPVALADRLRELGRAEGATLFMVLLGGFAVLLGRLSGQRDLAVGVPLAGRTHVELERLIGFFVNTLVLRVELGGAIDFRSLLARVREATLEAHQHQAVPFERLVEELSPERSLSSSPLFQAMLIFQNLPRETPEKGAVTVRRAEEIGGTEKFDLSLTVTEGGGGGLAASLSFATDLFDATTIDRWLGYLGVLLDGLAREPVRPVASCTLLSAAQRHQLLAELGEVTSRPPETACAQDLVALQATAMPDAIAVICGERHLSYGDLERRAERMAERLLELGLTPEERVGIYLERDLQVVVAILGIFKAGGAYVPLDPAYPARRTAFMLEDAGVSVLIARQKVAFEGVTEAPCRIVPEERLGGSVASVEDRVRPTAEPGRLAYVLYTSGSTGVPKGVAIEHRSVSALLRWAHSIYGAEELSGVLAATSISFDLSVFEILVPLSAGGRVVLVENVLELPAVADRARVRLVNTVPSPMAELARLGPLPSSVKTVNLAGEPLGRQLAKTLYELGVERVYNLYGPSEDTTYSTWWRASRSAQTPSVPIGRPLEHTRCFVLDPSFEALPLGVHGELCLAGRGLARGYLGRPGLTAERFVPDPFAPEEGGRIYRTGDLVRRLSSGELLFLGRIDDQVKVRGFRIELGEVESVLESHEAVREAVVLVGTDDGESRLMAWWVPVEGAAVSVDELRRNLRRRLPEFMVPSSFATLEQLPRTPGGKVDRKALGLRSPQTEPEPRGLSILRAPVEELLAGLWQEVLGVESVGAGNDFFALGGHSLLATRLVARIRHIFGVEVPIREVFEHRTLGALAAWIEAARSSGAPTPPPIDRAARHLQLPLSFGQERLWFLQQLEPGSSAYNIPAALSLDGALDVAALAAAFGELVRRHEVLRTSYPVIEGKPVQAIAPAGSTGLALVDLSALEPERRSALGRRLAVTEASRPFNLECGRVLRAVVFRLSAGEHRLLVTMHHIASDGWSAGIVMRELSALYEAARGRRVSPLPQLEIQYADFAVWQRRWLTGEVLAREIGYWRARLAGAPTLLELPTDRPRPTQQRFRGQTVPMAFGRGLSAELSAFGRRRGSTSFMVLLSVFQALLARQAGASDVVVGAPVAGRSHLETEGLVGFFVNTLVLRTNLGGEPTFDQLVIQVREMVLEAHAHQAVPFERLVEELAPERSLSHSPLFQVMLVFQSFERRKAAGGASIPDSGPRVDLGTAKYDLTLALTDSGAELSGALEYDVDLFDRTTARRLARGFEVLLSTALSRPDHAIWDLPLLSSSERHQVLLEWPDTECPEVAEMVSGGSRVYLLDHRRRPVPLGAVGELWLARDDPESGTAQPAVGAERFLPSPDGDRPDAAFVHGGSRARFLADGRLEFLGRSDSQALSRRLGDGPAGSDSVLRERIAPRDRLEFALVEIWRQLLDRDDVGVTESFFDLGGHSLLAFRMAAQIGQRVARTVPLAVIFRGPTIEALASWLRSTGQGPLPTPPWTEIQPRGSRAPMFWVHPVGGTVFCYLALSRWLGPEQPFFAFQAPGIEAGEEPLRSVEALAERYVDALIAGGIEPPFTLGGWSLGGVVAYEMARRLARSGRPAEHVILVDSRLSDRSSRGVSGKPDQAELLLGFALGLGVTRKALADLLSEGELQIPSDGDDEVALARSLEIARAAGLVAPDLDLEDLRRLLEVYTAHVEALDAFAAQPYSGSVSLLQATRRRTGTGVETARVWRELVGDGLEIHRLEGDHYSLLAEPDVRHLAERIQTLRGAEPAAEGSGAGRAALAAPVTISTSKSQQTDPCSTTLETDRSSVEETTGG